MSDEISRAAVAVPWRELLLDAAAAELAASGPSGVSVRLVARRAGVSAGSAYKVFSSKEHLLSAVFLRHLQRRPPADVADGRPLGVRLPAFVEDFVGGLVAEPGLLVALRAVFLGADADTARLRHLVMEDVDARLRDVCRDELPCGAFAAVRYAFGGIMLAAGAGALSFEQVPDEIRRVLGAVRPGGAASPESHHRTTSDFE